MFNNFILQAVMKVSFVRMTTAGAKARMTARFLVKPAFVSVKRSKLKKKYPKKKKVLTIFESDSLELEKAMEKIMESHGIQRAQKSTNPVS